MHRRERRDHAVHGEQPDAGRLDVDAHHARHVGVVADEHDRFAEFVTVEDEPEEDGERQRPDRLRGHDPADAPDERSPQTAVSRIRADVPGQPARQQHRDAVPEELRGERRHDRRHADARDKQPVDVADQRRQRQAPGRNQPRAPAANRRS